jgi:hypothetical protein
MNALQKLENFDLNNLDIYEFSIYENYYKNMSKAEALQIIINNVEGDFSQLSEDLAEIAEQQESEDLDNSEYNAFSSIFY